MWWRRAPALLIIAAAFAAAWFAAHSDFGRRLEFGLADSGMHVLRRQIDSDVVIIGIDARSLAELHSWPWPRRYHAQLIERIAPAAPQRLFLDIDFSSASNDADDQRLAAALAQWDGPAIILPAFFQHASPKDSDIVLTEPLPPFRPHVAVASVNLNPSVDGLVRYVRNSWTANERTLPSAVTVLGGLQADAASKQPVEYTIDYSIDPASFEFISFSDVLANRIPAVHFADKLVFVGATAIELGDMVPVPVYQSLPGVTVQALALESMLQGVHASPPRGAYWLLVAAWAVLLTIGFRRLSWRGNIALLTVALAGATAAALSAYVLLDTRVDVLPLAISAIATYLLVTLQSLEIETLRAITYAIRFRKRNALLKSIVLSSSDCIICIDADGLIKTANPAADSLFACAAGGLVGTSLLRLMPSLLQGPDDSFEALSNRVTETEATTAAGEPLPVELSISRVQLDDEHLYTAIIRDISERKAQLRQLQFQATHDPLTTLPNRPALAAHLDSVLASHDEDDPVALMMIDLNRFKEVNDTLGHNVGDHVLYEVARRLAAVARDTGFIARIGGDEFALIVDHFDDTAVISTLSQELLDSLKKPIETGGIEIDIGLSIGIALFPQDARDAETLFKQSDVAMYVAKRGGSGFEYYNAENDHHSVRRLSIASKLREAVAESRLELHYQPQISFATGRVESVEALLRWNDAELGAIRPDEFIALAEATDIIQPLTEWTLVAAFRQQVEWRAAGLDLRVAINLSARMLQSVAFPARLAELMGNAGIAADAIELEITESAMMVDPERALRVIRKLSELGTLISIDDYGTGYSSLAYLRDLPVHALKLDKSFVMNMQSHDDDRVIVESTVQMAHALQLKVVAEGVETTADAAVLRKCGYDYAQGFLYSAALRPDALLAWAKEFNRHARHKLVGA